MFSSARTFAYFAKYCSFYNTPTPTAAARIESNAGLITSIEEEEEEWRFRDKGDEPSVTSIHFNYIDKAPSVERQLYT